MHALSIICSLVLAGYVVIESARSPARYRELKREIDSGDTGARTSFYYEILWFEWISAGLAFAALGFAWSNFNPSRLGLAASSFGSWWSSVMAHANSGFVYGAGMGILIGVVVLFVALRLARHRAAKSPTPPRRSRILPDFGYLLPASGRERLLFGLVAISAGVCEEVVFRAWLLVTLHGFARLDGWVLVLAGSVVFGLAHYYQGVIGVLVTAALGLAFCGLYVGAGTLLLPIAAHALIDLRWAVFPSLPGFSPQPPS
ncbi:MAG: type II CAAX endopeptidase family protein [Candidatus Sulfotelmatobacter sp.]